MSSNNDRAPDHDSDIKGRPETPPPTPVGEDGIPPLWKSPNKVECFYPKGYRHPTPKTTLQSTAEPYHPAFEVSLPPSFGSPHSPSIGALQHENVELTTSPALGGIVNNWVAGTSDSVDHIYNTIIFSQRPGLLSSSFDIGIEGEVRPFSLPLQSTSITYLSFAEFQARYSGNSRNSTPDSISSGCSRNKSPAKSSLPLNKIRCFRFKGTVVWDRDLKVDRVSAMYRTFRDPESLAAATPITLPPPMGKFRSQQSLRNSSVGSSPADTPMMRSFRYEPPRGGPTKSYLMSSIHNNGEIVGIVRPEGPSKKDSSSGVSIATFNVFFELYDTTGQRHSPERLGIIISELEMVNTDIIALQEVTPYFYTAFRKSPILRKNYYWTSLPKMVNDDADHLAYSQVLLSKFPIVDACLLKLSRHKRCLLALVFIGPDQGKKLAGGRYAAENELLLVANCHLSSDYGQTLGGYQFKRQAELNAIYNAVSSCDRVSDFSESDRMMNSSASAYSNGGTAHSNTHMLDPTAPLYYLTSLLSDRVVPAYVGSLLIPGWTQENLLKSSPSRTPGRLGAASSPPLLYCQLQRSKELKAEEPPQQSGAPPPQLFPAVILGDFNCEDSIHGISPIQMLSEFRDAFDMAGNSTNQFTYDNMRNIWVEDFCGRQRFDRILTRGLRCENLSLFGEHLQWVSVQFVDEDLALAHRIFSQIERDGGVDYFYHLAKRSVHEANLAAGSPPEVARQISLLLQASDHFGLRCTLSLSGTEVDESGSPFQRAGTSPFLLPEAMN